MAAHKAIVSGLSGRYASALFDLAVDGKLLDQTEEDLAKLKALTSESAEFSQLLKSPLIDRAGQKKAVAAVAETLSIGDLTCKTLGVLAQNRRLAVLPALIRDFTLLLSQHRGEVSADVTSAEPLTEKQIDALKKSLKLAVGRDVAIEAHVDESLLGGLVIKVGSRMVDSSLKTKLDTLKVAMKGVQ